MVSAATKRRRQQRANSTAQAIEDSRREAQVEKKLLGTTVTADAPDEALFKIDRSGRSKEELRQKKARDAKEEARLLRQARRGNAKSRALLKNKVRRSERFAAPNGDDGESNMEGLSCPEGSLKKSHGLGPVEKAILKKRTFMADRHQEKRSKALERLGTKPGSHDLWTSDTKKEVEETICQTRKDFAKKHNCKYRRAKAIIYPDAGSSINPSYEHHQDKLGEALAKIVAKEDREQMYDDQLGYDPELFKNDRTDNIDRQTGMNVDTGDDDNNNGDKEDKEEAAPKPVTERKTRVQRNKEKRKRALQSAIEKKQRKAKVEEEFARIDELMEIAQEEADKFNGVAKRRARKNHVPVPNRRPNRPVLRKIAGERVRKEDDVEPIALRDDLGESLRDAKIPANNPMIKDRMLSFERRGFVESHKVMVKEMHNVRQFEIRDSMRDKTKRKGKHSKSDISYWKEKSKK